MKVELKNEASRANLNVDKRILKSPPFMNRVYICFYIKKMQVFKNHKIAWK